MLEENLYYLYRHIRPDKNEPFYIGVGDYFGYGRARKYKRAFTVKGRNSIWQRIYKKNNYEIEVDIILESGDWNYIIKKEIEFISLYGRINNDTGILSNMTNGGEGCVGYRHTKETLVILSEYLKIAKEKLNRPEVRDKMKKFYESRKGKKVMPEGFVFSAESKKKMSDSRSGSKSYLAEKVINTNNNKMYGCVEDALKDSGVTKWAFYKMLKGIRPNKTTFLYLKDYNKNYHKLILQSPNRGVHNDWKRLINTETGKIYECMAEASIEFDINKATLKRMLDGVYASRGKQYIKKNTTPLKYYDGKSL